jgi:type II secretory pathway pseudopilin PulG
MRTSPPIVARRFRNRLTRLRDEEGFTLVEAMAALSILTIGIFAVAQALTAGLATTGLSRQRLAARAALDQQMEDARTLNYDNLVLSDPSPLAHSATSTNPDYWVDQSAETYDPDGTGSLSAEPLIRVAGASPALQHYQNPLVVGSTTYTVYRYVTWVDVPDNGCVTVTVQCGSSTLDPGTGHDEKRVTIVVTWNDVLGLGPTSQSQSSLFTDGKIAYKAPAKNIPPVVSCPSASFDPGDSRIVTFTSVASDPDGTIASVGWTFGPGGATASGATVTHTFPGYSTYSVVNNVVDNGGGTATNAALNCSVTTPNPLAGNGGPENGTMQITNGATYTNSTVVTLNIGKNGGSSPNSMAFSNDGATWSASQPYGSSTSWTLLSGDGTKTVWARFFDSSGRYGTAVIDTIILDTVAPGVPTAFQVVSTSTGGSNKTVNLGWTAPAGVTDLGGYRMFRRLITSTGSFSLVCDTSATTCSDTHKKTDTYEYYVQAYDLATNVGPQSATPNPTG